MINKLNPADVLQCKMVVGLDKQYGIDLDSVEAAGISAENHYDLPQLETLRVLMADSTKGKFLKDALYNKSVLESNPVLLPLVDLIHSKRFLVYIDKASGEEMAFGIPSTEIKHKLCIKGYDGCKNPNKSDACLCVEKKSECIYPERGAEVCNSMHFKLFHAGLTYAEYMAEPDESNKNKIWNRFTHSLLNMRMTLTARIFSKEVKKMYQLSTKGVKGVVLPGNCAKDEVWLPKCAKKIGAKIGSYGIGARHPLQNLFTYLKVAGFTEDDTIRLHPNTIEISDGDFDGDEYCFVPNKVILQQMFELNFDVTDVFNYHREMKAMKPTALFERYSELYS